MVWPMAGMMASTGISNSDPGTGSGRRRPLLSGSPRRILLHTSAAALLPSALTLTGAARKWNSTPSSSASSISQGLAGISALERR